MHGINYQMKKISSPTKKLEEKKTIWTVTAGKDGMTEASEEVKLKAQLFAIKCSSLLAFEDAYNNSLEDENKHYADSCSLAFR